jgi:hypothetical protein
VIWNHALRVDAIVTKTVIGNFGAAIFLQSRLA